MRNKCENHKRAFYHQITISKSWGLLYIHHRYLNFFIKTKYKNVYLILCYAKLLQLCPTLCDPMDCSPPGSSVHGKNTGVGCHFLLQGIFPTQGLNRHLLRRQADSQPLSHQGLLTYYLKKDICCVKWSVQFRRGGKKEKPNLDSGSNFIINSLMDVFPKYSFNNLLTGDTFIHLLLPKHYWSEMFQYHL